MAALSVCFSISTRHLSSRLDANVWERAARSVALVFFFFFKSFFVFRPDLWQRRIQDGSPQPFLAFLFSDTSKRRQQPNQRGTVGNLDFFSRHLFFFSSIFIAGSRKKRRKKKGLKCECFFWKDSSVVSEDAVQFWLSILLCLCVLCLFVFALWSFERKKKITIIIIIT